MKVEYLVTMANQIADFWVSESGADAAAVDIASHITRFWEPRMRAVIIAHAQAGGSGLHPAALAAVRALKPVAAPATSVAG